MAYLKNTYKHTFLRSVIVLIGDFGKKIELPCETVVLSTGVRPRTEVIQMFEDLVPDVYLAGDCNKERGNLYNAILQGFFAAMDV